MTSEITKVTHIIWPHLFHISATSQLFRYSGKNTKPSSISTDFKSKPKPLRLHFPVPDRSKADGWSRHSQGDEGEPECTEGEPERTKRKCSLEKWCRETLTAKYTPWHWYKGQRGRTFWVLWSQEHSTKRRGKENMMIKWMKYIKATAQPRGAQHWNDRDLPRREVNGEDGLQDLTLITPSYPSIQLKPQWWLLNKSLWYLELDPSAPAPPTCLLGTQSTGWCPTYRWLLQVGSSCEQEKPAHSGGSKVQAAVLQGKSEQRWLEMVNESFLNKDFNGWLVFSTLKSIT